MLKQVTAPADHACFNHRGRWAIAPRARVLVEHRAQRIGPHAYRQWCRVKLAKVSGTRDTHGVRCHSIAKALQDLFERDSLHRQWLVEKSFQFFRSGFGRDSTRRESRYV